MKPTILHAERKHSPFSASGADRWFKCPGSVSLSEGLPSRDNVWSIEGTQAHEVVELLLRARITKKEGFVKPIKPVTSEMIVHGNQAADFIYGLHTKLVGSEILVETRITLPFIHPSMFGTFDGAVVDHFGTLHVFDYKFGKHSVSPIENLQMIFYGIGLAHQYNWNFKKVRLWIVQPRIPHYEGPTFWEISIDELRSYVYLFKKAVHRVLTESKTYVEGPHCHWCKAKGICPKKLSDKLENARMVFRNNPLEEGDKMAKKATKKKAKKSSK